MSIIQSYPPALKAIPKNTATDNHVGYILCREITAVDIDGGVPLTSFTPNIVSQQANKGVPTIGAKSILWRVWSNASGGTVSLQWLSVPADGPKMKSDGTLTQSLPTTIIATAATTSGSTCPNRHPVTNEASSSSWYEMSNHTPVSASVCDNRITEYPSGSATSYGKFFEFDVLGDVLMIPLCYVAPGTSATSVIIAYKIVE